MAHSPCRRHSLRTFEINGEYHAMSSFSKSCLWATSALVGLSMIHLSSPAKAQEAFGIHNDQPEPLVSTVGEDETVEGDDIGVYADDGPVDLTNAGTVRGDGTSFGSVDERPGGGVVISQPGSIINNSGEITGAANGVTTAYFFSEDASGDPLPPEALAANTTIINSGLIRGEAGTGVSLIGGGNVSNSGTIQAFAGNLQNGAQAIGVIIAEFPDAIDPDAVGVGAIINSESGLIEGQLFGALLSGGGTIDNAGIIRSTGQFNPLTPTVSPFGVILTARAEQPGRIATLNNSGTVSGFFALLTNQSLETAIVNNSGTISGIGTAIIGLSSGELVINNAQDGQITANGNGIASNAGTLIFNNSGLVGSNSQSAVSISTAGAVINNSGLIQGGTFGITTNPLQTSPQIFEELAINTTVTNSGSITGLNNDGIRLGGGGTITNSGTILGLQNVQADGVSIFNHQAQDLANYLASVINVAGASISGNRFGVIVSAGGTVENAGTIAGVTTGGVLVQNGTSDGERSGSVTNSGSITGGGQYGVGFLGLSRAALDNSGTITGSTGDGVYALVNADGVTTINNLADGIITGAASGVHVELGGLVLANAGTIIGNGTNLGQNAPPDAGVTLSGAGNNINNSGTIDGFLNGITTASYFDLATNSLVGLAVDTLIVNTGTITGRNDDGIRLIGGGSVINSGEIRGLAGSLADGISMFPFTTQANEGYNSLVTNQVGGEISGTRFGVILSGGGDVVNSGDITGVAGGIFIQGTALNSNSGEIRSGLSANVINTGSISGTGNLGGTGGSGYGVGFGSDMSSATFENSGTITSDFSVGVSHRSRADLNVINILGGNISGATSGIYSGASGSLLVNNAGTIRGEGTYDGPDRAPDAGITIATAGSGVTNSGTISGARLGITTAYVFDSSLGRLVFQAAGSTVANSGTISGQADDGVRLIGGGSVINSGAITGSGAPFADGVSMFRFDVQLPDDYSASVSNAAGANIDGDRFGILLSGGGSVENAGVISGNTGGVVIQSQLNGEDAGLTASLINSGSISSSNGTGTQFNAGLETVTVDNSGSIAGAITGLAHGTDGSLALTNRGTISGGTTGIASDAGGAVNIVNSGTIEGGTGAAFTSLTQTSLDNSGILAGGAGIAVLLGALDDTVILRTGSSINGVVDAGDGNDGLTLSGGVLELTQAQQLGASTNFETLEVASGYWTTIGPVGQFATVNIAETGALQVNEIDLGVDGLSSPILTSSVTTEGLLVLNFSDDGLVSELDELSINGAGGVQLIGEAVFAVDTDTLTYTGGTTISNGGLILSGTLLGDVLTQGDGAFQLGAGGTEGSFAGNIVNNGTFIFNRSDNYDFLGSFSGSGNLNKLGDSTLTFMGDYAFTGVTTILGGTVRIGGVIDPETEFELGDGTLDITGSDQTIAALAGEIASAVVIEGSELTVNQEGDTEFAGSISGDGSLIKEGEGTLNLTGDNTYTGPTDVNEGILAVNGSVTSDVTVNDGGTLGGNGTITGSTAITAGGKVGPGNSIGQLSIIGDLDFAAGSIYEVEVNAAGQSDRIDVTGAVTINSGASVAVLAASGNYAGRTDYTILTGGSLTGRFGSVSTDLAFLDPLLRYNATTVTLSLYRNDIDFADVAIGFNQASVAGAVQSLGIDNPVFEAVLAQNAVGAQDAFDSLSGEILVSAISGLADDGRHLRNAITAMKAPEAGGAFIWGSAFGGWGQFDANNGRSSMDTDNKGFVAGIGFGGNGFGAALSAGLGKSDFDLTGSNDHAGADSKYLAAHATFGSQAFHGSLGVSYAWHDIATTRSVSFAPLAQSLMSKRDADTLQVFGELAYDLSMGTTAITPFVRLAHVRTQSDGFAETGGNAALLVADAEQKVTFLSLGARLRLNAGQQGFQPYLSAAWSRAFGDRSADVVAGFAAGGSNFTIVGSIIPKDAAEIEAGFDYSTGPFRIGTAYSGTLASDRNTHGARVTATFAF